MPAIKPAGGVDPVEQSISLVDKFPFTPKNWFSDRLLLLVTTIFLLIILFIGISNADDFFGKSNKALNNTIEVARCLSVDPKIAACMVFADLDGAKVEITQDQLDEIVAEKKDQGITISVDEAKKFALGRAKIEIFAKKQGITVTDEEISKNLPQANQKQISKDQVRGVLLSKKVEEAAIAFSDIDWIMIRWDWKRDDVWMPQKDNLATESRVVLDKIRPDLLTLTPVSEIVNKLKVDDSKYYLTSGTNTRWSANTKDDSLFKKILSVEQGSADIICDDRQCTAVRVLGKNSGKYASFQEFMGDLWGW